MVGPNTQGLDSTGGNCYHAQTSILSLFFAAALREELKIVHFCYGWWRGVKYPFTRSPSLSLSLSPLLSLAAVRLVGRFDGSKGYVRVWRPKPLFLPKNDTELEEVFGKNFYTTPHQFILHNHITVTFWTFENLNREPLCSAAPEAFWNSDLHFPLQVSHGNGQSLHAEKDCDPSLQKWGNSNCRNLAFNSRKAASGASVQCRASERRRDREVKAASQRERRRSARNFPFPLEKDRKTREREGERDLHAHAKKTLEESQRERERERGRPE